MQKQDTQIVSTMIDRALAKNYTVSVHDGEAFALGVSSDKKDILAALESTDTDTLIFRQPDRTLVGKVFLVHGNEDGVIVCDYTDVPAIQELVA